jgi:hypothetical protein
VLPFAIWVYLLFFLVLEFELKALELPGRQALHHLSHALSPAFAIWEES